MGRIDICSASLGIANCSSKNYPEAFDNFLKATHADSKICEIWFDIGILYEIHQQFSEAEVAYKKAIEVSQEFTQAAKRRDVLNLDNKPPLPQLIHPEFHIQDTMIPQKSFLNNLALKNEVESNLVSIPQAPIQKVAENTK